MDDALTWWPFRRATRSDRTAPGGTTARFGGDDRDAPVLAAVVHGTIEIDMAEDALREAELPALVKRSSLESTYTIGSSRFISAEVWTHPAVAERARDVLIGIGVIEDK